MLLLDAGYPWVYNLIRDAGDGPAGMTEATNGGDGAMATDQTDLISRLDSLNARRVAILAAAYRTPFKPERARLLQEAEEVGAEWSALYTLWIPPHLQAD